VLTGAKEVDVMRFQVSHVAGSGVNVEANEPYLVDYSARDSLKKPVHCYSSY
jgi:hypothetical protein